MMNMNQWDEFYLNDNGIDFYDKRYNFDKDGIKAGIFMSVLPPNPTDLPVINIDRSKIIEVGPTGYLDLSLKNINEFIKFEVEDEVNAVKNNLITSLILQKKDAYVHPANKKFIIYDFDIMLNSEYLNILSEHNLLAQYIEKLKINYTQKYGKPFYIFQIKDSKCPFHKDPKTIKQCINKNIYYFLDVVSAIDSKVSNDYVRNLVKCRTLKYLWPRFVSKEEMNFEELYFMNQLLLLERYINFYPINLDLDFAYVILLRRSISNYYRRGGS